MPQPRQYRSNAERQAAHRARKQDDDVAIQIALSQLNTALWDAGDRGDDLALACRATLVTTMVKRLTRAFQARPDPAVSKDDVAAASQSHGSL